jgi:hypothetical protein
MARRKKPVFEVGNQVHLKLSNGERKLDTMYEITRLLPRCGCFIRECGRGADDKPHREQRWDTSLLLHAVTDEMLAGFSLGPLKAGR